MDSCVTGPSTREELILAIHALFDAQMGPPRAIMELPAYPDRHIISYPGAWETRDVLKYETLRVGGQSEEGCVQTMWWDIVLLWQESEPRSRLYWRLRERIQLKITGWWRWKRYHLRTRIALPGSDFKFIGLLTCPGEGNPSWNI